MRGIDYRGDPRAVLIHFNPNHDPNSGQFTSGKVASLTNKIHSEASNRVEAISNDVISAAKSAGSQMYGLEHRQKTKESISRKIKTDATEKLISFEDAANDIKDAVRFTTVSDEKNFVKSYNNFKRHLARNGYDEIRCKNYFQLFKEGKVKHKSVQSVFATNDGYRFEVQFQTPASQDAKNKKLPLYEEARKVGVSPKRLKELERQMEILAQNVNDPPNIEEIKTH